MANLYIVITASFNRPELLIRNIKALQKQVYENWIQIIVDDCSTSNMQEVYELASSDNRIHVIKLSGNSGCNYVRNQALSYIEANNLDGYITLVDDDDYLLPDALEFINNKIDTAESPLWITADCCYPDGKKASKVSHYGMLSYIDNYMYGNEIKGDLNHFIHTSICKGIKFSDCFKNGQEWSFFCQVAGKSQLEALSHNVKVIEYLAGGLSNNKVNAKNKIKVFDYKVKILKLLVSDKRVSHQQLLLARELLNAGEKDKAKSLLFSIFKYQYLSLKFYRYLVRSLV